MVAVCASPVREGRRAIPLAVRYQLDAPPRHDRAGQRAERLLFVSDRPGPETCNAGPGRGDMYLVRRNAAEGWGQPRHLGCVENGTGPNTNGTEFSPSLVNIGKETYLYFSSDISGNQDIYRSRLGKDGQFGAPVPTARSRPAQTTASTSTCRSVTTRGSGGPPRPVRP